MLKYNFESNSQLIFGYTQRIGVGNYMLKYNFESNSQQTKGAISAYRVGNYMLKYNFESNSQLMAKKYLREICWELYAKVQF